MPAGRGARSVQVEGVYLPPLAGVDRSVGHGSGTKRCCRLFATPPGAMIGSRADVWADRRQLACLLLEGLIILGANDTRESRSRRGVATLWLSATMAVVGMLLIAQLTLVARSSSTLDAVLRGDVASWYDPSVRLLPLLSAVQLLLLIATAVGAGLLTRRRQSGRPVARVLVFVCLGALAVLTTIAVINIPGITAGVLAHQDLNLLLQRLYVPSLAITIMTAGLSWLDRERRSDES